MRPARLWLAAVLGSLNRKAEAKQKPGRPPSPGASRPRDGSVTPA